MDTVNRCLSMIAASASFFLATAACAAEQKRTPSVADGVEQVAIDEPAFPNGKISDTFRIWTGSYFVPPTDFGGVDLGLARPELRVRLRLPVSQDFSVQLSGEFRASFYDTDGQGPLFADCPDCPSPDEFYSTMLAVQTGYLLNRERYLLRAGEQWALLSGVYARARFEQGAFDESVTPGFSFGIGYQIPSLFRIALGARVERSLDGDGVKIGPSGYLRWEPLPKWRLRTRALGLQLEYRALKRLELFLTGYQSSDRFRLDNRPDVGSGSTFRDRQAVVGGGLVVKILRELRMTLEAGAVVDRRISVDTRDDGTLDSVDGDTAPYFAFRFEIRP
jgi:hypothetical protein